MKKVLAVLIASLAFASCKKEDVTPVNIATINTYCKMPPYEVSYWAIGGEQKQVITTQRATINFAWDSDYANNINKVTSLSGLEGDSIWLDMKVDGKYGQKGLKLGSPYGTRFTGFNYHFLK